MFSFNSVKILITDSSDVASHLLEEIEVETFGDDFSIVFPLLSLNKDNSVTVML
jgi:hypothetical protein